MRWVLLLSFLALSACSHTRLQQVSKADASSFLSRVQKNGELRETLSGFGAASVQSSERSGTGHAVLQLQWPERFRMEFQDPLARRQLLIQYDERYFFLDDVKQSKAWLVDLRTKEGTLAAKDLLGMADLGQKHFKMWLEIFLAKVSWDEFYSSSENALVWQKMDGPIVVDRVQLTDDGEEISERILRRGIHELKVAYGPYQTQGIVSVPSTIEISVLAGPKKGARLFWKWNDWQSNIGRSELLHLPPGKMDRPPIRIPPNFSP